MDTDLAWDLWGRQDPYFGVLTDPKFRSAAITPAAREEFFALGQLHVEHVLETCRARIDPSFAPTRVLDFGCGVGRLLIPFSRVIAGVVGVDVAPSMLAEARRNCDAHDAQGVTLLASDDALSAVEGDFDLVHTCIVLQHIPVARGRSLFAFMVDRLRAGGCGAVHVTFAWTAHAETHGVPPPPVPPPPPTRRAMVKSALRDIAGLSHGTAKTPAAPAPPADPEMQMNYYNLSELMFILQRRGVERIYTELTDHGGALGAFLFFQKPA